MAGVADAPTDETAAQELRDGQSVQQPHVRQREYERGYPEIGVSVREIIAHKVDLLGHSHDVRILNKHVSKLPALLSISSKMAYIQENLVEEIQCVTATQEGDDTSVNSSPQTTSEGGLSR